MQCAYIENKSETTTAGLWNFFHCHMYLINDNVDRIQNTVTDNKYHSKS